MSTVLAKGRELEVMIMRSAEVRDIDIEESSSREVLGPLFW
jgi:hypothetical protein